MNTMRFNPPDEWLLGKPYNVQTIGLFELILFLKNEDLVNGKMIEIGSYMGESTSLFAMSGLFSDIYAIDPWEGSFQHLNENQGFVNIITEFNINNRLFTEKIVHPIIGYSQDVVHKFNDDEYDVIYVDGDHDYTSVKRDIQMYLPKLKSGGFMCGHDYNERIFPNTCAAIDEIFGKPHQVFSDESWVVKI